MLDDLYLPDYKRLGTMLIGAPGSGKSKFTEVTLKEFGQNQQSHDVWWNGGIKNTILG